MCIKRMFVLAGMAFAAIAFAAPAAAQAEWLHDHEPLESNATVHMEGTFGFEGLGSGIACPVTLVVEARPGDEGDVTDFDLSTGAACEYFGLFEGCTLESAESTTPWDVHVNTAANNITITEAVIHNEFDHECPAKTAKLTFHATATPDNATTISTVNVAGEPFEAHLFDTDGAPIGSLPSEANGLLHLSEPNTYGIG